MSIYGAVPSELRAFGLKFVAQQESVSAIQAAVVAALSNTTWTGPARDAFEASWNGQFNSALNGLKAAFDAAGREAMSRADGLEQVMGVAASA
jgi:hypothetical protein